MAGSALGATEPAGRASAAPLFQLEPAHAEYVPVLDGSKPIFVLVIGSDAARSGGREPAPDAIHVHQPRRAQGVDRRDPRDAYVDIPGQGQNKINAALFYGGPELVVQTVEELTGLKMDYWAMTGFASFEAMVDDVDGLVVDVPFAMSDEASRAFFEPGVQTLDGDNALAFARNRHDLPAGDFGRSENQGRLMVARSRSSRRSSTRISAPAGLGRRRSCATDDPALDEVLDLAFTGTTINANKV